MLLKALGVNSAFSVGSFQDAVPLSNALTALESGDPKREIKNLELKVRKL